MYSNWHVHHVRHHLHDVGIFLRHTSQPNQPFNWNTLLIETIHNCFGTETSSLHQRPENSWCITSQIQPNQSCFKLLICIWCSSAIQPIEREFVIFLGREFVRLSC